jgi:tRNA (cytidine/uridine-2'-O-)-methyltransferase
MTAPALPPMHVVLVEPEIPPNTGTIARLCIAMHVRLHLIEPLGFRIDDRTLQRAGMDYWRFVDLRLWPDWAAFRRGEPNGRLFFLTTKTTRSYLEAKFQPGDFLVFGRETRGLPESLLRENADACLTIPMPNPDVRSLNLATATAIVLSEALRQTGGL